MLERTPGLKEYNCTPHKTLSRACPSRVSNERPSMVVIILRTEDQEWWPTHTQHFLNDRVDLPVYAPEDEWGLLLLLLRTVGPNFRPIRIVVKG